MAHQCKCLKRSGERGRNRTFNLLIKSQLLCQLSYAPVCGFASGDAATSLRTIGDSCSRDAALRIHRIGRMRVPMKNITQPVTLVPTLGVQRSEKQHLAFGTWHLAFGT